MDMGRTHTRDLQSIYLVESKKKACAMFLLFLSPFTNKQNLFVMMMKICSSLSFLLFWDGPCYDITKRQRTRQRGEQTTTVVAVIFTLYFLVGHVLNYYSYYYYYHTATYNMAAATNVTFSQSTTRILISFFRTFVQKEEDTVFLSLLVSWLWRRKWKVTWQGYSTFPCLFVHAFYDLSLISF